METTELVKYKGFEQKLITAWPCSIRSTCRYQNIRYSARTKRRENHNHKAVLGLASQSGAIFGQDIVQDSVEIRKRIGYLAQDPRFYEHMTARETLRFKARFYYSGPAGEIETRITQTVT